MAAGLFLTVEGMDGAGKSTQARRLAGRLREAGREVVETREPGGTAGAEEIRALLVEGTAARWSAETEILLFTAARRDHVEKVIRPALAAGRVVVSDRFADSTRVYQGTTPELRATIDGLHAMMIGIEPDLTVLLDLAPGRAAARTEGRAGAGPADRFDARGDAFHAGIAARFRALAAEARGRIATVEAGDAPDAVAERVWAAVAPVLAGARTHG